MITNHHRIILFGKNHPCRWKDIFGKIPVNTKMKTLITNEKNYKISIYLVACQDQMYLVLLHSSFLKIYKT